MGLSRNKVAVSEGAAGSPPFYGEQAFCPRTKCQKLGRNKKKPSITDGRQRCRKTSKYVRDILKSETY